MKYKQNLLLKDILIVETKKIMNTIGFQTNLLSGGNLKKTFKFSSAEIIMSHLTLPVKSSIMTGILTKGLL